MFSIGQYFKKNKCYAIIGQTSYRGHMTDMYVLHIVYVYKHHRGHKSPPKDISTPLTLRILEIVKQKYFQSFSFNTYSSLKENPYFAGYK